MKKPLITCIVPAFNGQRYLREAIDSILAQTYRSLELVVVDDGSTDGTRKVAETYGEKVRYLYQTNEGPAAARNRGVLSARGSFVAFLDQDDLWHPKKLERQLACFEGKRELDLCVAHVRNFQDGLSTLEEQTEGPQQSPSLPGYVTGTLLARLELFRIVGEFNPKLSFGDAQDWFLHAAEQGATMMLLPQVLLFRRLHQANLSLLQDVASREEFLETIKRSLDRRRRKGQAVTPTYSFPEPEPSHAGEDPDE